MLNNTEKNITDNKILKKIEVEMKLRGFSANTIDSYLLYNQKFLEYIKKSPEDVTEDDIKEFMAHKMEDSISNGSLSYIKSTLKFYYDDILGKNFSWIKTPRSTKRLPVVLTKNEIKELLDCTENEKHRLMIELLYSTGLRLSECINLKYSDLDLKESVVWVRKGKGSKDRIFIISDKFKKDLLRYKEKKGEGEYIFTVNGRKTNLQTTQIYTQVSSEEIKKIKSPLDLL